MTNISAAAMNPVEEYSFVTKWGSMGSSDGQFVKPQGIAIDLSSGNVFVADTDNNRIQKFSNNGTFIAKWGSKCFSTSGVPHCLNAHNGEFLYPTGIAVDLKGNVFVADSDNNRIQKFSNNGTFIAKWGSFCDMSTGDGCSGPDSSRHLEKGDGQFLNPTSMAVDLPSGNVFVTDYGNNRIQKFSNNGTFIAKWGFEGQNSAGYFSAPTGIAVDSSSGNVFVTDDGNNDIQKFSNNGTFIAKWGSAGSGNGQFIGPYNIAVDSSSGNVFVTDYGNNRIQKFSNNGTFIAKWGSYGPGNYQFTAPTGIAVEPSSGYVYVADAFNNRIQVFDRIQVFALPISK